MAGLDNNSDKKGATMQRKHSFLLSWFFAAVLSAMPAVSAWAQDIVLGAIIIGSVAFSASVVKKAAFNRDRSPGRTTECW